MADNSRTTSPDSSLTKSLDLRPPHKLSEDAKRAVVCALARFDDPSAVATMCRMDFDVVISRQSIQGYDPTKRAGRNLSQKWRAIFHETRARFLNDVAAIPVANKAVRLRALGRMAVEAEEQGSLALSASLLEQAAKEVGDVYTNRQRIDATVVARDIQEMTDEELMAIVVNGDPALAASLEG